MLSLTLPVLASLLATVSSLDASAAQDQMQAEMKAALDAVSNASGYSFSVCFLRTMALCDLVVLFVRTVVTNQLFVLVAATPPHVFLTSPQHTRTQRLGTWMWKAGLLG